MKRKVLFQVFLLSLTVLFFNSCVHDSTICLVVEINIKKPDGTDFTQAELEKFKYSLWTRDEYYREEKAPHIKDSSVILDYWLGTTSHKSKIKKIVESFDEKLPEFGFKIEDPDNVYQTYEMKPLDNTYEVVNKDFPKIKYTIKLTKKSE